MVRVPVAARWLLRRRVLDQVSYFDPGAALHHLGIFGTVNILLRGALGNQHSLSEAAEKKAALSRPKKKARKRARATDPWYQTYQGSIFLFFF